MTTHATGKGAATDPVGAVARVMVPLSGAAKDERAVPVGVAVARRLGLPITLMSAVSDPVLDERLRRYLGRIAEGIDGIDVDVDVVLGGHPPLAIVEAARAADALPVMASSGHLLMHGRYLGSAAAWVVRELRLPALLVGAHCDADGDFAPGRVIVPIDGSLVAGRAIPLGAAWARRLGASLHLLTVLTRAADRDLRAATGDEASFVESNHLHNLARQLHRTDPDLTVEWEVFHNDRPGDAIAASARDGGLLCMTTHGRSGLADAAMGSVTRRVVREAHGPVLAWCPPDSD